MNLVKLFEMQKVLDDRILEEHPELKGQNNLDWKILALQVELGECANEWRGFKKWSKDQEPRTEYACELCEGSGEISAVTADGHPEFGFDVYDVDVGCPLCEGEKNDKNPLLEEYVDCLHFILSIGLELGTENVDSWFVESNVRVFQYSSVTAQFIYINQNASGLYQGDYEYNELFYEVLGLGEMLGFTAEQVEQAYISKNEINHARQAEGY